jgi:hypothetical protein
MRRIIFLGAVGSFGDPSAVEAYKSGRSESRRSENNRSRFLLIISFNPMES